MTRRTTIITLAFFTILSALEEAKANDWAIRDIYGDTPPIFIPDTDSIDLTLKKESRSPGRKNKEKSIGSNLGEFTRDSFIGYGIVWAGRTYIAPKNAQVVITDFLPKYLRNLTGWQDFNGARSRKSLLSPPLLDGDSFETNFIKHPVAGMSFYFYYRALGYDRTSSALGCFLQSTLFEYTIEGWQQSPSLNDLILTPALGIPVAILLEEISDWLAERDNQVLRALSYVVNPTRILAPEGEVTWQNFRGVAFRFNLHD